VVKGFCSTPYTKPYTKLGDRGEKGSNSEKLLFKYDINDIGTGHIYVPVIYGEYSNSVKGALVTQSNPDS